MKPRVELVAHSLQPARRDARRRKLDRERKAVEPAADIDRQRDVFLVERERGMGRSDSRLQQGYRAERARVLDRKLGGHRKGSRPVLLLLRQMQRFLARREDMDSGCGGEDRSREKTGCLEQVLA